MVLALFAFRVRPESQAEFQETVHRMVELVQKVPGFISMDMFQSEDGRMLAVPRFESEEALLTWRNHPEHKAAQAKGKAAFFEDYWIDVCSTIRSYEFHRSEAAASV
jgi:heme-degrading monooxygenase HmoA